MAESAALAPPRPRRPVDLADRIVALQRKNAVAGPSQDAGPSRPKTTPKNSIQLSASPEPLQARQHAGRRLVPPPAPFADEFSRRLPSPKNLVDEFSRGPELLKSSPRMLYDPSRPPPTIAMPSRNDLAPSVPRATDDRRWHAPPNPHAEGPSRHRPEPGRQLFDPTLHDPHHFQQASTGPSRSLLRRVVGSERSAEEEADRLRERRRRREGSERGSAPSSRKKDSDGRSKDSRSSEGSESFKDRERGKGRGDTGVKAILKEIHDQIKSIEAELTELHRLLSLDPEQGINAILPPRVPHSTAAQTAAWIDLIQKHKTLADLHHEFLVRVFDPLVPSSLHQLTVRYNIPSRLWQVGFHLILERLRHAWMTGQPAALDLLTDFLYDAYKFYTDVLEDQSLGNFRTAWIEALGDLARYRMAIASHLAEKERQASSATEKGKERQDLGRIDDDETDEGETGSIGVAVAQSWDVEDKETWRTTAREWYTMGITEKPGEGRLHHHLALLCRDVRGMDGRALHHFTKSLIVTHDYPASRESLLPLFDTALQTRLSSDAAPMDMFIRLHGMLFTRVQLDDFPSLLQRFSDRLGPAFGGSAVSQVDWMIMAAINTAAVLQYGAPDGVLRRALAREGFERRRQQATNADEGIVEDEADEEPSLGLENGTQLPGDNPTALSADGDQLPPITYTYALQLLPTMFTHTLKDPFLNHNSQPVLNPYLTVMMTFLATLSRQAAAMKLLLAQIPWQALVDLAGRLPAEFELREEARLIAGPPLPEDWLIRGEEWVGRRVFERGFWKTKGSGRGSQGLVQPRIGERFSSEIDVLTADLDVDVDDQEGVVDDVDGADLTDGPIAIGQRRWRRIQWALGVLVKHVDGFDLVDGALVIQGPLKEILDAAELAKKVETLSMPSHRSAYDEDEDSEFEDGETDDPELAILRERRQHLHSLLDHSAPLSTRAGLPRSARHPKARGVSVIAGYTTLIFDTNVLLSSLSLFSSLVDNALYTLIVPLPVVTELDGISRQPPPLGTAAASAIGYLEQHVKSHSLALKIQTSKGSYLSDLRVRSEEFGAKGTASTMDDRILDVAVHQLDHWRPKQTATEQRDGSKVVLVTFDRNLRLKARARGVDAADEKEMASILAG